MDERTFRSLELSGLVELLARHVQTPLGRRRVFELHPVSSRIEIEQALDLTTECAHYISSGERFGLSGIEDPEQALARLHVEATALEPLQILVLERLIAVGTDLRAQFKGADTRQRYPHLAALTARIPDLRRLLSEIRGKILPSGEVDDSASPELRMIRREINEGRIHIHRVLESMIRQQSRAVQEEIVTFRNGRFVIPVRTDSRGQVPGVVHALSSSGQTTFIEPLAAIDLNNELVRLREQEVIEIARILSTISQALRDNLAAIRVIVDTVASLDFAQAKGRLSVAFSGIRPALSSDGKLVLRDARHILLDHTLRQAAEAAVPISFELDQDHRVLVISGPNAGGKTVVVKTVGLIALMTQMGLHVPAREAVLPVFDQVFADIGDQQSIAANLSTFTAHMRNISEMARNVAPPALILLDEVGTGTDPDEGAALAVAIVDYFRRAGAITIATTHYSALKMWASRTEGVRNASVEFDEQTLRPTYRLLVGLSGASAGIEIARRMDVPPAILESAQVRIEPSHAQAVEYLRRLKASADAQDALCQALEEERSEISRRQAQLELDFSRRETARQKQFDQALAGVTLELASESQRLISALKDRAAAQSLKKAAAKAAAELRNTGERLRQETGSGDLRADAGHAPGAPPCAVPVQTPGIKAGDHVKVLSLGKDGVVDSVQGATYSITVGSLRFRATRDDLQLLKPADHAADVRQAPQPGTLTPADIDRTSPTELNVIGLTADEATEKVDRFIDAAFLAGAESIRIIHGHGKGILRRAIADLLANHPQVEKFRMAPPDQGGSGVTIVDLRE